MTVDSTVKHSPSFQHALETCYSEYGPSSVAAFQQCTLQEVLNTVLIIENARDAKGKAGYNIKHRLMSLISFVERYATAVDSLVQVGAGSGINPAALIWGLLRILLEVASSATKYLASLLGLIEELGTAVSLYNAYEDMFLDQPRFQDALVNVYSDIIVVLNKAGRALQRSKSSMFLRCFKSNFEIDFRDELDAVKRHLTALANETTLAHRTQVHNFVTVGHLGGSQLARSNAQAEFRERVIQWLAPIDCGSRLADIDSVRQRGSGSWLFDNKSYRGWRENISEPLLWITGPAGIGKTVLSSTIIADVRRESMFSKSKVVYFHCDAGDQSARSSLRFFASLIVQITAELELTTSGAELPPCLVQAYERSVKYGRPSISKADSPEDVLPQLLSGEGSTTLVVDGLDEMEAPESIVRTLLRLSSRVHSLRIVFLSRDFPNLEKLFLNLPRVKISPSDVQHDICSYVQERSTDIPVDDIEDRKEIVDKICAKAEGMFLWARMVVEDLVTATSIADLKQKLHQCPPGLSEVYGHFLRSLASQPPHRRKLARDMLRWSCCATRPLSIAELKNALSTSIAQGNSGEENVPFDSVVANLCSPFLTVTRNSNLVKPIHQSVREYLLGYSNVLEGAEEASKFFISEKEAHKELAIRCIRYLEPKPFGEFGDPTDCDSFGHYAITSWCHHAVLGSYGADLEAQIVELISTSQRRQSWLYWMLFNCHEPFPFRKIFRLQQDLRNWAKSSDQGQSAVLELTATDWSMDALDLLLQLSNRETNHADAPYISSNIDISYFEKMMVVRALARRLTQNGQLSAAIATLEKLRMTPEDERGTVQLTFLLNILGILYDQQERAELALYTHRKALAIQETRSGKDHAETVWTVNEMGRMYRHLSLLDESVNMHQRALEVLQSTLPEDHPERIWTINTLATTLRKQNRSGDALRLHLQAFEARRNALGELHPHTLWTRGDVAKCYRDMGEFQVALSWYQRALEGRITTLGPEDPDTLWSMNDCGMMLAEVGRYSEAVELQEKALEVQERVLGAGHQHAQWTRCVVKELKG